MRWFHGNSYIPEKKVLYLKGTPVIRYGYRRKAENEHTGNRLKINNTYGSIALKCDFAITYGNVC